MPISCRISLRYMNGIYKSIYCHWDGYIKNMREILKSYEFENTHQLMEMGDLYYVCKSPDMSRKLSYSSLTPVRPYAMTHASRDHIIDCCTNGEKYIYLLEYYQWKIYDIDQKSWKMIVS